jgi:hypothetical protein
MPTVGATGNAGAIAEKAGSDPWPIVTFFVASFHDIMIFK